jgi:hypothetical protein
VSIKTVAELKRRLVPGTRIHIENHKRPVATRDTVVLPETNSVDLVTLAPNTTRGSHTQWPKRSELLPGDDDRTVHILQTDRDAQLVPFLTITILEEGTA